MWNQKDRKSISRYLVAFAIIGGMFLFFALVNHFDLASKLFGGERSPDGEYWKFVVSVSGGFVVLFGLYINYDRTQALHKQNEIAIRGNVDGRFRNAIDHLGSDNPPIILGGIHELYRIAEEDKSYRKTVFDILCSYIRQITTPKANDIDNTKSVSIVTQTILDALFKETYDGDYIFYGLVADLSEANLKGANLDGAHLEMSSLYKTDMEDVSLISAHLENARITEAKFGRARLWSTEFDRARIEKTDFSGANFMFARIDHLRLLEDNNFERAIFSENHLEIPGMTDIIVNIKALYYPSDEDSHYTFRDREKVGSLLSVDDYFSTNEAEKKKN